MCERKTGFVASGATAPATFSCASIIQRLTREHVAFYAVEKGVMAMEPSAFERTQGATTRPSFQPIAISDLRNSIMPSSRDLRNRRH